MHLSESQAPSDAQEIFTPGDALFVAQPGPGTRSLHMPLHPMAGEPSVHTLRPSIWLLAHLGDAVSPLQDYSPASMFQGQDLSGS